MFFFVYVMSICMWCCMSQCTHMQGPEEVPATACLLYLLILFLKWLPLMAVAISDSMQGNTLECPLILFSVSTVYIWHWQLSRKSAWTLDALVDTLTFSPIANLFLFSVTYQCFVCFSLLFCPFRSFSCLLGDWAPLDSGRAISSPQGAFARSYWKVAVCLTKNFQLHDCCFLFFISPVFILLLFLFIPSASFYPIPSMNVSYQGLF